MSVRSSLVEFLEFPDAKVQVVRKVPRWVLKYETERESRRVK